MIQHYFYENQIRSYIRQFMSIFYGLHVKTGKGECEEEYISVPCIMGFRDRVVSALMAEYTKSDCSNPCNVGIYGEFRNGTGAKESAIIPRSTCNYACWWGFSG